MKRTPCFAFLAALALPSVVAADPADDAAASTDASPTATAADAGTLARQDDEPPPPPPAGPKKQLSIGVKVRYLSLPRGMIEWFVERVPSSSNNVGFGAELAWRRENSEFAVSLNYDTLSAPNGLYLEQGQPIMGRDVDDVTNDGLSWITADLTWIGYKPFNDTMAFRYGGGLGIGVMIGGVNRTDQLCTSNTYESCADDPAAENVDDPYNIPPVLPSLNGFVGLQVRPQKNIAINIDGGIRALLPTISVGVQLAL
ncbi:MAG: hypothetical protein IPL79_13880 [Myxococcales bacterium]|nr:hypothetical protein [Myxococcales bacterium]